MKGLSKHIILLIGLVLIAVSLTVFDGSGNKQSRGDLNLFTVSDTSAIQQILMEHNESRIEINRDEQGWVLNDTMDIDPSLIGILGTIMSNVEVIRPVSQFNYDDIKSDMQSNAQKVTLLIEEEKIEFYAGGNAGKTQAYFADADFNNIYIVAIPGYNNYLSGIFELTLNQWRQRVLFASSWRTIQSLEIEYIDSSKEALDIYFEDRFMKVRGITKLDTSILVNYLSQFENFQLNDYLVSGNHPRYDSLKRAEPVASIKLIDIDKEKNRSLSIYDRIKGQKFVLLVDDSDQMIVIDTQRISSLLQEPSFFESEQ